MQNQEIDCNATKIVHERVKTEEIEYDKDPINIGLITIDWSHTYYNIYDHKIIRAPIHLAINYKNIEILKLLLKHDDINVNAIETQDNDERSALYLAIDQENVEAVEILLTNLQIDINYVYTNYIHGHKIEQNRLIGGPITGYVSGKFKNTVLTAAIRNNNIEIIRLLLEFPGIDVNIKATTIAYKSKLFETEEGKDIILQKEETPLNEAVKQKNKEIIELLCQFQGITMSIEDKSVILELFSEKEKQIKQILSIVKDQHS